MAAEAFSGKRIAAQEAPAPYKRQKLDEDLESDIFMGDMGNQEAQLKLAMEEMA
jgi:hypothetical protein